MLRDRRSVWQNQRTSRGWFAREVRPSPCNIAIADIHLYFGREYRHWDVWLNSWKVRQVFICYYSYGYYSTRWWLRGKKCGISTLHIVSLFILFLFYFKLSIYYTGHKDSPQ